MLVQHLKTTKKLHEATNDESKMIIDRFFDACMHLDASIFEPFMDEESIFEKQGKYEFLTSLKALFESKKIPFGENFIVTRQQSKCTDCSNGKYVEHFKIYDKLGKSGMNEFGFLIETNAGILIDIYQCFRFKGCLDEVYKINTIVRRPGYELL